MMEVGWVEEDAGLGEERGFALAVDFVSEKT